MKKQKRIITILVSLIVVCFGGAIGTHIYQRNIKANQPRVIVTTVALAEVFAKLKIPVVGVPTTNQKLPNVDQNLPRVGNHIAPNIERIVSLKPKTVFVDDALVGDYQGKLNEEHIDLKPVNFTKLANLQQAITQLGTMYHREKAAEKLNATLVLPAEKATRQIKVLVLMGMPGGSYMVGTNQSYIGDLVERAGGKVVGGNGNSPFVSPNMEMINQENPEMIIVLAHAMPQNVKKAMQAQLRKGTWKNIQAVKQQQIHYGELPTFAPTANLHAPAAFAQLHTWMGAASR
ncbi:iron ABC transporter substrate-binding protein [Periweissella cryptocerci]|uniref:Iron ABC transporter substrate-binding protein n=1 Tax=Periweissella cryptocerci TaxID=2506420 RepID=A0A4P6YS98_9LACO|nr:ABC transporter substrate-binding protein [Periweissella cryptocerci]QBO35531.1 iron ABC transporter substrate-binding protein [Periweissella cryptocerci]